ncbi:hypothetical protein [Nakamurella leprariae]|uniref:Uncharacterized protein n=1 Tax=Nakamurella leprariae TaxID=2803911 RepID=A0A939C0Q4_9ACTN|nr:hypothetical protein [Nakamurella leprariae]MBM9466284.1 hypothetical protein [Nakamurella leprariae]
MSSPGNPQQPESGQSWQPSGAWQPPQSGGYPSQPGQYPNPQAHQQYPGQGPGGWAPYGGGNAMPAPPSRPGSVTGAFVCHLLTIVAVVVSAVVVMTSSVWDRAVEEAARQSQTTIDVDTAVTFARVLVIAFAVVIAGLLLLFAIKMLTGRNWARIVLTVLSALTVLSGLSGQTRASVTVNGEVFEATSTGSNWIGAVIAAVAIVLMYVPASNQYFHQSKQYRAMQLLRG